MPQKKKDEPEKDKVIKVAGGKLPLHTPGAKRIAKGIVEEAKKTIKEEAKKIKKRKQILPEERIKMMKERMKSKPRLTLRQERFCQYYVANNGNATQAVKAAGFECGTDGSAAEVGSKLLKDVEILARLAEIEEEHLAAVEFTAEFKYKLLKSAAEAVHGLVLDEPDSGASKSLVDLLAESNKMAGHYAASQAVNKHVIAATDNGENLEELIKKFEKEE